MATSKDWVPQELKNIFHFLVGMKKQELICQENFLDLFRLRPGKKQPKVNRGMMEILTTFPLDSQICKQLHCRLPRLIAAIANGGTLYKPQIVNKIISGTGADAKTIEQISPEVVRSNFIDPANLEIVREGMRDGVDKPYGLSATLNSLPIEVAAKTGTAEIGQVNHYNVWSSVFAPYTDPQIVLVVTAEDVNGLGAVTLPVAKDVLNWYFSGKK